MSNKTVWQDTINNKNKRFLDEGEKSIVSLLEINIVND